eukprot:CAMPEP_0171461298 /NCGR_PEP_ID=MMETSP0945-20130129/5803_1 /TAXON_ID=109269 /ORGANISM="Vaucheria litorea, Strain CCMP2940" /LENGTH=294 /DNA_ID=CAMNT_0011987619 /DNA_START=126 /DNA_END=1010 /DNA_ORIENTATION=+
MSAQRSNTASTKSKASVGCCEVIPVPVLSDNYSYIILDCITRQAACVDPAEPSKVIAAAVSNGIEISSLLCTHKHWDHSGGNLEMKRLIKGIEVYGSAYESDLPGVTRELHNGDTFKIGSLTVKNFHAPCHTRGHSVFYISPSEESGTKLAPVLFTGDTLFVGGCGRFFEGDAKDMQKILGEGGLLSKFPKETLVYCGHEYTLSNLRFALSVDKKNKALASKMEWAEERISKGEFTVPSTIDEERSYNPFMRTHDKEIMENVGASDPEDCMRLLRERKNGFRPPPTKPNRFPPL